jgi:pSer/pThr/pTyr-binding forkhead associated (FHA) protein
MQVDEPVEKSTPEPTKLPRDRSDIQMTDQELVLMITPYLSMPDHFVQASEDHANSLYEKHSKDGVEAFAKLAGKGWAFYVTKTRTNIGRPPEAANPPPRASSNTDEAEETPPEERTAEANKVHIDLGPSKMVSRLHAEIYFDTGSRTWVIVVNGRNGIRVNNNVLRRGQKHPLTSGEVIEISGIEMMFVLPTLYGRLQIDRSYLIRAGLLEGDSEDANDQEPVASTSSARLPSTEPASRGQNGGPLPIAPAPPDYKRPGTPTSARPKPPYSAGKSPAYANGGTILMNADDVDLSLDSNQHIKPSYSYAQMISQAIFDTDDEKLNLNGIYNYIMDKYAYYRHQLGGGWQVS